MSRSCLVFYPNKIYPGKNASNWLMMLPRPKYQIQICSDSNFSTNPALWWCCKNQNNGIKNNTICFEYNNGDANIKKYKWLFIQPLDDQAQQVLRVMMIQTTIKQKAKHFNHTMATVDDSTCSHFIISTLFVFALVRQWSESVSEPDSSLSAKSDLRERSFLRACIKISYEIVLDSTWQVLS